MTRAPGSRSSRPGGFAGTPVDRTRHAVASRIAAALALVWIGAACTDAGLQPTEPPGLETFDNLLEVRGEFCTQPDDTVVFPVKVLFVVDQSSSLQCTDPNNVRFNELDGLFRDLLAQPETQIGTLGFASWIRETPFTTDPGALAGVLSPASGGGVATDYQGALATVARMLEEDMVASGPALRARTRYVVVFVSDGTAEPRCRAGCEDDVAFCSNGEDDDGDGRIDGADEDCEDVGNNALRPDELYGICNFQGNLDEVIDQTTEYVEFSGRCPAYNQDEQILQGVRDVLELQDTYSVGAVTMNTVLLFAPQDIVESRCPGAAETFGYQIDEARSILRAMAREGSGVFRDVNLVTAGDDGFLDFDFRALEAPQWLSGLSAVNTYAQLGDGGFVTDIDQDGLGDDFEFDRGLDPRNRDSDVGGGDGYGDLFELRYRSQGYDPLDANVPAVPCRGRSDLDGDGLLDCEEETLGTDVRAADSDGDGILDFREILAGTNPTIDDGLEDLDFDGVLNIEEVVGGTNALVPDEDRYRDQRIQYRMFDEGRKTVRDWETGAMEERQCYGFEVRNLQLVVTPLPAQRGLNRIVIYSQEQPAGLAGARAETQVACFDAFYRGESSKEPESGVIDVSAEGWFRTLSALQGEIDALAACEQIGEGFRRGEIERFIAQCLPATVALGRYASTTDQSRDLLRRYVAGDTAVNVVQPASELFVPLATFDPDRDCFRPWELDRLSALFDTIQRACRCETIQDVSSEGVRDTLSGCIPGTVEEEPGSGIFVVEDRDAFREYCGQ